MWKSLLPNTGPEDGKDIKYDGVKVLGVSRITNKITIINNSIVSFTTNSKEFFISC